MRLAPEQAALLVVDLQKSFCDPDGSMARQGRAIEPMRRAADQCRDLVAAMRRAGRPVIWTRMAFRPDYADGGLLTAELRPNLARIGALRAGTADAGFADGIAPAPNDVVVEKRRYSALVGTDLEAALRHRNVDTVLIGGVTTSMCVESTVRDLGQRDYRVFVVREACGDFDADRHEASLAAMDFGFARVVGREQALAALAAGGAEL